MRRYPEFKEAEVKFSMPAGVPALSEQLRIAIDKGR